MPHLPLVQELRADWGFDSIWCRAAKFYASRFLRYSEEESDHVCVLVTTKAGTGTLRHMHQSWTSLASSRTALARTPQRKYNELNEKLKNNSKLGTVLQMSFPDWYLSGDDISAHPLYVNRSGTRTRPRWKQFYGIPEHLCRRS